MDTVLVSITISIFALFVTIINAIVGIANFVLGRFRLLAVREVVCSEFPLAKLKQSSRCFTVDVVSYGASIWDMEVQIELVIPDTKRNIAKGFTGTIILGLKPRGNYTNPLNAGQGTIWEMWSHEMLTPEFQDQVYKCLPLIPYENITLCIYCNQKRKQLRRIRSSLFHWQLDSFLEKKMNVKLPRYLYQYLAWKNRHILRTDGRSLNTISRTWRPPWQ